MAGGVYDGLYNGYRSGGGSLVDYLLLGPRMALRAACTEGEAKEVIVITRFTDRLEAHSLTPQLAILFNGWIQWVRYSVRYGTGWCGANGIQEQEDGFIPVVLGYLRVCV